MGIRRRRGRLWGGSGPARRSPHRGTRSMSYGTTSCASSLPASMFRDQALGGVLGLRRRLPLVRQDDLDPGIVQRQVEPTDTGEELDRGGSAHSAIRLSDVPTDMPESRPGPPRRRWSYPRTLSPRHQQPSPIPQRRGLNWNACPDPITRAVRVLLATGVARFVSGPSSRGHRLFACVPETGSDVPCCERASSPDGRPAAPRRHCLRRAVGARVRARAEILAKYPDAERIEVESHWKILGFSATRATSPVGTGSRTPPSSWA